NTNYIGLGPSDVIAQVANISFDAATFEVWGALLHGGRLVIVPQEAVLSPQALGRQLQEQAISAVFFTTALFNLLAREAPGAFGSRDTLRFGGEAVNPRWVRQVLADHPPRRLLHVYGPTESTTFATWHEVRGLGPQASTVPIGGPLANTQVYVLD